MVLPDGHGIHHLDWQPEKAVPLRKNPLRLTAPNPGMMTGPGTNSYLVGDAHTGYIAIDPGPDDAEHLQRLHDAAGGDIRFIVCTHSHPDHSPGAAPLQAMVLLSGHARPPIMGLPSAPTARANSRFRPEVTLQDGERITLTGQGTEGEITHTLQAVFTPGHAANHLCFVLEEDALLFSGDHILNGSTTVISPPDGNMIDYLDSLTGSTPCAWSTTFATSRPPTATCWALRHTRSPASRPTAWRARPRCIRPCAPSRTAAFRTGWRLPMPTRRKALWPVAQQSLLAHVERIQKLCLGR
jgi:glyoxylase-like metal-dependent hydrolase (beta-lactamase superfamily II)